MDPGRRGTIREGKEGEAMNDDDNGNGDRGGSPPRQTTMSRSKAQIRTEQQDQAGPFAGGGPTGGVGDLVGDTRYHPQIKLGAHVEPLAGHVRRTGSQSV